MDRSATRTAGKPALHAGGNALTLVSASMNLEVLRALEQGPRALQSLRALLGFPPQSTLRLYLRTMSAFGAVERRSRSEFPTSVDYEITEAGRGLLRVAAILQSWLDASPHGATELGSVAAKSTVKALVEGWASNIVRAVAAEPLSLTELDSLIPRLSYPSLERRLTAMRQANLIAVHRSNGRLTPYGVTEWLRRAAAPVIAAIAWEGIHAAGRCPRLERHDVEAAFLLTIPLMELGEDLTGRCRLAVEIQDGASPALVGARVCVEEGKVTGCFADLEGEAEASASGKPLAWLRRLRGAPVGYLEVSGDVRLAEAVTDGLRRTMRKSH
jgi:DNA-binding HxlR family transcriptional regulator